MKYLHYIFLCFCSFFYAQKKDTLSLKVAFSDDLRTMKVSQKIIFYNKTNAPISEIKFLNWAAAYKKKETPLAKRKLENRKNNLYFANENDLASVEHLAINNEKIENTNDENIFLKLNKPLNFNEKEEINLEYTIKLPHSKFTGYGSDNAKASIKYFFITPDNFPEYQHEKRYFHDIEETANGGSFWRVDFQLPNDFLAEGNLQKISPKLFEGQINTDPEFVIQKENFSKITCHILGKEIETIFAQTLRSEDEEYLRFYLPLHLSFLHSRLGLLPNKLFISKNLMKNEDFLGNDDIGWKKWKFKLFSDAEKIDLDYFSIVSKAVVNEAFISEKNKNHWLKNGLKTHLEIEYLKKNYADAKLLGQLSDKISLWGIKPLNLFNSPTLPLSSRYGIAYQYIMGQNLDQAVGTPFVELSNFNNLAISHFEAGNLIHFIADKMGERKFYEFIKNYISENKEHNISTTDFLQKLSLASEGSSDFLEKFIEKKERINFKIKRIQKQNNILSIDIQKNTDLKIPFKITAENKEKQKIAEYWFDTSAKKETATYTIPLENTHKILLNENYGFPEANYRDNYLYTKGLFSNIKKPKIRLVEDIPNPEFYEIYVTPKAEFNAYDGLLFGAKFTNSSLFQRDFVYSIAPYYSTKTNSITGSSAFSYTIRPTDSFFQSWSFGVSGSHFHYDKDLSYQKLGISSALSFRKDYRSSVNRAVIFSYNFLQKDLSPTQILANEYGKYSLWNIGYQQSDNKLIHETSFGTNLQIMNDFSKISTEYFHRWEYAPNKKIAFRVFGGFFLNNKTKNNLFDFGISQVSNYSFSYGLLGQSATSGIFSQQYILADGGFKSMIKNTANQWITSMNIDGHIWKMFNLYADFGVFKNKNEKAQFIYDTGVKVKLIPDFLEIYLPVQSSLGFEPTKRAYPSKIRFSLIFSLNSFINYFRRGWY